MKLKIIVIFLAVVLILLAAALAIDSVSSFKKSLTQLVEVDEELTKQELRYLSNTKQLAINSDALSTAVVNYTSSKNPAAKRAAFQKLVEISQPLVMVKLDVNNPLERRLSDEIAGALNRHRVAGEHYSLQLKECNVFADSFRAKIARIVGSFPIKCDEFHPN